MIFIVHNEGNFNVCCEIMYVLFINDNPWSIFIMLYRIGFLMCS